MTVISIASATAGPVLGFYISHLVGFLGFINYYHCWTDLIAAECKALGICGQKVIFVCLTSFVCLYCLFILHPANFIKALGVFCNNHRQCNRKIYIYNDKYNKINEKRRFRP